VDVTIINEYAVSSLAGTMNFPERIYYSNQEEAHLTSFDFPAKKS
jgi:hypothetical protein